MIGAINFEYSNFNTNLISKISRSLISKTSDDNFEFSFEHGNFENVAGNLILQTGYVLILLSLQTGFVPRLCG